MNGEWGDIDIDPYISLRDRDFEEEYECQCDLDDIDQPSKFTLNGRQAVTFTDSCIDVG